MASTYSSNLRLELIGTGDQQGTWGITTNTNLGTLLEEAIGGYISVTVSDSGDTTLTVANGATDQSRNMVINLTGTISAARTVICPAIEKLYVVRNATTGGFAVTFKVSGQTGVSIPNGSTYFVYVNGTDVQLVNGTIASQNANNVSITGGSISGAALSNVTVVANASSLSVRDADGSHTLSIAAGSNLTANRVLTLTTGDAARTLDISSGNVTISTAGANLIDDADASAQRTTLGLGTIATQDANNVTITGGTVSGITDVAVSDGGTGVSSFTAYSVVTGGTTATGALQSVSGVGSSGEVLTSNGSGSLPSWQAISVIPSGSVMPFAGATEPSGWLLCYGQNVSRSTYAALFAVIGTTYGSGDGSTTFGIPDLRGRVVAGQDDMGGTSANRLTGQTGGVDGDVLGAAGGSETHTLTTAQMPSHSHRFSNSSTISGIEGVNAGSLTGSGTIDTSNTGGGDAHNNVQPTFILNYIIKI